MVPTPNIHTAFSPHHFGRFAFRSQANCSKPHPIPSFVRPAHIHTPIATFLHRPIIIALYLYVAALRRYTTTFPYGMHYFDTRSDRCLRTPPGAPMLDEFPQPHGAGCPLRFDVRVDRPKDWPYRPRQSWTMFAYIMSAYMFLTGTTCWTYTIVVVVVSSREAFGFGRLCTRADTNLVLAPKGYRIVRLRSSGMAGGSCLALSRYCFASSGVVARKRPV
ncbi:hypothetical protein C8Q77DRAFT_797423 [Trametes polyzona]|nr:hypothetical protein C8Q77DRAFT_797423 [Trametes polyzona]